MTCTYTDTNDMYVHRYQWHVRTQIPITCTYTDTNYRYIHIYQLHVRTQIPITCTYTDINYMYVHRYQLHVRTQIPMTCTYTDTNYMYVHRYQLHVRRQIPIICTYTYTNYMYVHRYKLHGYMYYKSIYTYLTVVYSKLCHGRINFDQVMALYWFCITHVLETLVRAAHHTYWWMSQRYLYKVYTLVRFILLSLQHNFEIINAICVYLASRDQRSNLICEIILYIWWPCQLVLPVTYTNLRTTAISNTTKA